MLKTLLTLALSCLIGTGAAAQQVWTVDHDQSALRFSVDIGGTIAEGGFDAWSTEIAYDPLNPASGQVTVAVDVTSVTIDDTRARAIVDAVWLGVEAHPIAVFAARGFELSGETDLRVPGTLSLKGIDAPLTLTGTLVSADCTAEVAMTGSIDRALHDIGVGQSAVAPVVTLTTNLVARCDAN